MPTEQGKDDWTAPGAFEVAPDMFRIPLPLPGDALKAVNVYAFLDGDGVALVDSGWSIPAARDELTIALAALGATPSDIHKIYVTHLHRDHYGQAMLLRRDFGSRVWLGEGERETLELLVTETGEFLDRELSQIRTLGAGALADEIEAARAARGPIPREVFELPDEWMAPGEVVASGRVLTVVPTPGHTRGHVVFHDEVRQILLAGDHVLPSITPSIGYERLRAASPLGDFLTSLAKIRDRPDALLAPAHGAVGGSVHARIDELIEHHAHRLDETEAAVRAGAVTAYDVAQVLRWTRRRRDFTELDHFNRMLATNETDAHLQVLLTQQRVTATTVDGVQHFS